jgi:hypothetical protein
MKLFFSFSLFILLIASACTRTYICPPGGVNLSFSGYDTSSVDSIIVNTYKPSTNFSELIGSRTIQLQYEGYPFLIDNLQNYIIYDQSPFTQYAGYIKHGFDYEIITSNHNYKISGVNFKQRIITKGFEFGCKRENDDYSPIDSYYLNGEFQMNNKDNRISLEK